MRTTTSTMATGSPAGVGSRFSARISPSSLTTAPAIFVPPMSIPMAVHGDESSDELRLSEVQQASHTRVEAPSARPVPKELP